MGLQELQDDLLAHEADIVQIEDRAVRRAGTFRCPAKAVDHILKIETGQVKMIFLPTIGQVHESIYWISLLGKQWCMN